LVKRIFDDLDVNNDGKLSLEEYKLNSMKEPLIIDFLGQFLADQTDSGSNSICSALSVPPSPRSGSSPPSPRFSHFAPPSPRLRDSLYGTASGHPFQSSSPAGSFRLSNSHSLLWLNGGVNGSGDLLGKVNEFEGLVAAEEEQAKERKAAEEKKKAAATTVVTVASALAPVRDESEEKTTNGTEEKLKSQVDIVVVPAATEATTQTTVEAEKKVNGEHTSNGVLATPAEEVHSTAATVASDEIKEKEQHAAAVDEVSQATLQKAEANGGLEIRSEPTLEETTAKLNIQSS
jgi:hypothetical protein